MVTDTAAQDADATGSDRYADTRNEEEMKLTWFAILAFSLLMMGMAVAQSPPPPQQKPLTASDLENQMQEVGCKAERQAAASTILQMKQQIEDLQNQIKKLDPPKSGATKH